MGTERAAAMMKLLPPAGWGDVATRRDLELLELKLDRRIDRLELRVDAMSESMASISSQMATKADLAESRVELQRTLVTWILAAQATVVAAIGLLLAFVR